MPASAAAAGSIVSNSRRLRISAISLSVAGWTTRPERDRTLASSPVSFA